MFFLMDHSIILVDEGSAEGILEYHAAMTANEAFDRIAGFYDGVGDFHEVTI